MASASTRKCRSVAPPAGHGTISVTGLVGKFCACAGAAGSHAAAIASNPSVSPRPMRRRVFTSFLPGVVIAVGSRPPPLDRVPEAAGAPYMARARRRTMFEQDRTA